MAGVRKRRAVDAGDSDKIASLIKQHTAT
ncbi:hypothetical protein TcasGA2_TC012827 [Tribolium castaneum]|uniref:Uncharacterized protein n=1 Tax=Tribolium castaneum TaxID=7070 RepID=D6X0X4_TRICA|nr:hypothetical protein TcasGA2_TC012827 [Tribolium castaneum]